MPRQPGSRVRIYEKGGQSKYVEPFSQWQLLIENTREQLGMSLRELGRIAAIPSATLFNWVRHRDGAPRTIFYTNEINKRLAQALRLKPDVLAQAYNQSTSLSAPGSTEVDSPAPPRPAPGARGNSSPSADTVSRLIRILESTGRTNFTIEDIKRASVLL